EEVKDGVIISAQVFPPVLFAVSLTKALKGDVSITVVTVNPALRLACLSARVQRGFEMHIHERCRLGGELWRPI
ncbi:hypothetical protein F7725_006977, partial [Dissostichus mawsoni]